MVSCPKCITNNTLDSAFCRKCGATLPSDVIAEEQAKLKEIVTKGMDSFQNGNSDEAMAIAEHSILTNPSFAEAYALKGMVHERRSQYAEALDCYETVVALQPDSTLDKIKLNQLRNAFAQRQATPVEPDKKSALLMSVAACVAIGAIGFGVYWVASNSKSTTQAQATNTPLVAQNSQVVSQPLTNSGVKTVPNPIGTPQQNAGASAPGDVQPEGANTSRPQAPSGGTRRIGRPSFGSNYDTSIPPMPVSGDLTNPAGQPINGGLPSTDGGRPSQGSQGGGNTNGSELDPKPEPSKVPSQSSENAGQISVSVTKSGDDDQVRKSLENAGTVRMQTGDNDGASKAFNSASSRSGASGKTHQRAGQSLMRSGKKTEAIGAFERAISAYEKELQSGKGDKASIQAGLNSCRQAIRTLKND